MMAEADLINRRLLDRKNWNNQHTAAGVVAGIFYLIFLLTVIPNASTVDAALFVYLMMIVLLIVIPITLHGVIAGEREKRSLDMLLSAPVTSAEIVWAKLHRARGMAAATVIFLGGPLLITLVSQMIRPSNFVVSNGGLPPVVAAGFGVASVLFAGFASGGITLLVSSRAKTAAASMMANLAVHFGLLAGFPFIMGVLATTTPFVRELGVLPWLMHPIGLLSASSPEVAGQIPMLTDIPAWAILMLGASVWVLYTTIGFCCLQMAARRLDQERRI